MTDTTSASPETALSVDQAVERLMAKPAAEAAAPEPASAPEPVEAEPNSTASPPADDTPSEPSEVNGEGETEEVTDPAQAAEVTPPHWWTAEEKDHFAKLPPELQNVVLKKDKDREAVVTKAQQAAATATKQAEEARTAAEERAAESTKLMEQVTPLLTKAADVFKGRWDGATAEWWLGLSREDPAKYQELRPQFEYEIDQLQQLNTAKQAADQKAQNDRTEAESARRQEWVNGEAVKLKTLIPELMDPAKATAILPRIVAFAKANGVTEEQIANVGAAGYAMAYKAMLAEEAKASLTAPKPKAIPVPAKPAVKPASGQTQSRANSADSAKERLAKSGRPDDAVALLMARSQKG